MTADHTPDLYAVMGNPIAHSKSPFIHTRFARQTGQHLVYEAILVDLDGFEGALAAFRARGGRGANVTVPFKEQAWARCDRRSPRAERAGAVNTLLFADGDKVFGDNTDGVGLVRDLTVNHGAELGGRRILLVGAGGAARGVVEPLLELRPAELMIANRTVAKGRELAAHFAPLGPVAACGFDELDGARFDLIVNATAAGLHGALPPLPDGLLAPGGWCYDMMYADEPTVFVRWGLQQGAARSLDGLGMLVEQAAESFYLWRGVRPDTAGVITSLRAAAGTET